jgi:hypothetical protein
MSGDTHSNPTSSTIDIRFVLRLVGKALGLFVAINLLLTVFNPIPWLAKLTAYNSVLPGRLRLPYGENPQKAYNLNLYSLEAMFSSHEIAGQAKEEDEYRVVLIGDSSVWGFLLKPEETLSGYINLAGLHTQDGRRVRVYNLGYPTMSLIKDALVLSKAMQYQPDLVLWMTTLESFPYDKQLASPIVQNNPEPVKALIRKYNLKLNLDDSSFVVPTFWDKTLIGQRRAYADLIRLQLYGVLWAATGVDQEYPDSFPAPKADYDADESFHDLKPPHLTEMDIALDILTAGVKLAGDTPVLIVNEPMFISSGRNSQIRYNFFYPRWAYDDYRMILANYSRQMDWNYLDLWDLVDPKEFTNTALHLTPTGSQELADYIGGAIVALANR